MLQEAKDFTMLRVGEAVRQFGAYYPAPRDPDEVIAAVGLTEQTRTLTSRLSGGQRRRLDVALGIVGDPELLFLDEPTTGFDPAARRQFWELIRLAAHRRDHDPAHHALPGRGRGARRPGRRAGRGPAGRGGRAGPARRPGPGRRDRVAGRRTAGRREQRTAEPTRFVAELVDAVPGRDPGAVGGAAVAGGHLSGSDRGTADRGRRTRVRDDARMAAGSQRADSRDGGSRGGDG